MKKGIIFDMDGTILDSSRYYYNLWNKVFQKRFNIEIPEEVFADLMGMSSRHFAEALLKHFNIGNPFEDVFGEVLASHNEFRQNIKLKPGAREALVQLKKTYRIALATGAMTHFARDYVKQFRIERYFDFIIGGDMVKVAKPNPEIFLKAAEGIGIIPEKCVVVEDAFLGLKAARAAGMQCIIVFDEFTKHQDFGDSSYRIESLSELPKLLGRQG